MDINKNPSNSAHDTILIILFAVVFLISIGVLWKSGCEDRPGQPERQAEEYRRIPREAVRVNNASPNNQHQGRLLTMNPLPIEILKILAASVLTNS